jgi:predicted amidohydrolase
VIVDPLGATLAALADAEGVAVGEVSRERLKAARARLPILTQRRAALNVGAGTPASRR